MRLGFVALALVLASAAQAGDGRIEINQRCVDHPCVPGDPPGFPIFLEAGGNYVLTSDIVLPGPGEYAVSVPAGATLDLAGFRIAGTTTCSGEPVTSCTPTDAGSYGAFLGEGAVLRNGTISNMGDSCVLTDDANRIENMVIEQCGGDGIEIEGGNDAILIRNTRVSRNLGHGIDLAAGNGAIGTLVTRSTITGNGQKGVYGTNLLVLDSAIHRNGDVGVDAQAAGGVVGLGGNALIRNDAPTYVDVAGGLGVSPNFCTGFSGCP